MSCFEILGIVPTNDKTEIKRAFAKKVKENPPDKDAALYQQIREAYTEALREADYIDEYYSDSDDTESASLDFDNNDFDIGEQETDDKTKPVNTYFDGNEALLEEEVVSPHSIDIAEIAKLRDSMQTADNARTLSDIAGYFKVRNWYFSEGADQSFLVKFLFWLKFPIWIGLIAIFIIRAVAK